MRLKGDAVHLKSKEDSRQTAAHLTHIHEPLSEFRVQVAKRGLSTRHHLFPIL